MNNNQNYHRLNIADILTLLRIGGTILLVFLTPVSKEFFYVYAFAGLTDVLDGWIARKTKTASDFGARLDSIADLLFYLVMLVCIFPILWERLPKFIWIMLAAILIVRAAAYLTAAVKYHRFASLHTYLNKLTGLAVFLVPFMIMTDVAVAFCLTVCIIAAVASFEELVIYIKNKDYSPNVKSLFHKQI